MKEELFRIEYLDVNYNSSLMLSSFSMELIKGEVLGIYTKNFSEIECLINTLRGDLVPLSGRILFKNFPLKFSSQNSGTNLIVICKQCQLIDSFTVADNIFVIRKGFKKHFIDRKKLEFQAGLMLDKLNINISAGTYIQDLTQLEKIIIQMTRAYILRIPIVIFKNLSSFLSDDDIDQLYPYVILFREAGLSFIVMDSTGNMIETYCHRVIILNRGRNIWTFREGEFSENILTNFFNINKNTTVEPILLDDNREDFFILKDLESNTLKRLNVAVKKGEITGLVDVEGSGIEEVKNILFGVKKDYTGEIIINGSKIVSSFPLKLLNRGVAVIDEDPSKNNLFRGFNGLDNLCIPLSKKVTFFWQNRRYKKNILKRYAHHFSNGALLKRLKYLNTKDLHSLAYLRWHLYSPDMIILVRPFSSVERQLEDLTISLIDLLLKKGIGIIILTSNLWELSTLSTKLPVNIQRLTPSI